MFDREGQPVASAQREFEQHYPRDGWVEHDPETIWRDTLDVCREALGRAGLDAAVIAAIGITNQRETVALWERATGRPVHRATVWQDRRTADRCARLVADGHEALVGARTGLVIDPYFSATKLAWLLARGDDVVPIPGTKRRKYLEQNIAAVDLTLSVAEVDALSAAFPPGIAAGLRYPEFQLKKLGI